MEGVELVESNGTITTEEDAKKAGELFNRGDVDLLLIQSINADSGILVTILGQKVRKPILIWSTPEPTLHNTALVANSLCGAMIIAATLRRLGIKYKHLHGWPEDEKLREALNKSIRVLGCISVLKESKLGLVGYQSPGFHHVSFDEMLLRRTFGTSVQHIDLSEVYAEAGVLDKGELAREMSAIKREGMCKDVKEEDFEKSAAISISLRRLAEKYSIHAFAVKCFPEFVDIFKLAPCVAVGRTTDEGLMTACEGDMIGALTMLIEHYLTGKAVFFVDIIAMDKESNTGVVWHCGNAPICMAEDPGKVMLEQHSILGVESPRGLTREFACKTGPVTCARLSEREGGYRMYAIGGEAVKGDPSLRGTSMKIKFHQPVEKISEVLFRDGVENHFAVVYGDIRDELEEFSSWLGIDSVIL
ncbi:L-fucose/L-arabinose isomerase family protein [Candidatus Bathyarchaeota archaeon]|nr:L-fucose/L-arabinose isomerase family protein [Candidatus Bathyarchaeota archaeon]